MRDIFSNVQEEDLPSTQELSQPCTEGSRPQVGDSHHPHHSTPEHTGYITLDSKRILKPTKKITNLAFLQNRQYIQNFSTYFLSQLVFSKLFYKFT